MFVNVRTNARSNVVTKAYYRTTETTHYGAAGGTGRASVEYRISDATPGYRVVVRIFANKHGYRGNNCSTSFVPHR